MDLPCTDTDTLVVQFHIQCYTRSRGVAQGAMDVRKAARMARINLERSLLRFSSSSSSCRFVSAGTQCDTSLVMATASRRRGG